MKLTPNDIRNPKRKSGYDHVHLAWATPSTASSHGGGRDKFQARYRPANWHGPRRETGAEAAQDYCDYINGSPLVLPTARLKSHGHKRRKRRKIQRTRRECNALKVLREEAAKRKEEVANYIYLVGMEDNPAYVKIGEAFDPEDRYIGGQTFNPYTLVLLGYYQTDIARDADKVVHQEFAQHQRKGEWFVPADEILARFNITRSEFLRRCGGTTEREVTTA